MRVGMAILLLALAPAAVVAQEPWELPDLPGDVEDRVRAMAAAPGALHTTGPTSIPGDSTVTTSLVVSGGGLGLDGRVVGDVLVLNGDLLLGSGAQVDGDVLVIGGEIRGIEAATVGGTLLAYGAAGTAGAGKEADRERARGVAVGVAREGDETVRRRHHSHDRGGIDLGVSVPGNYNRVEGLPIMFGPVIRTEGPNRLHIEGQAMWRTDPSASIADNVGWRVRAEQGLFSDRLRIAGEISSMVQAIETRGLNSTESGLAAAIFHSDLHDYFHREGWAVRLEVRPERVPLEAGLEYRRSEHGLLLVSDPWSLLRGDEAWRLQPVVAEGDITTLGLSLALDTRDDRDEPTMGFVGRIGVEHALEQDLVMPSVALDGAVDAGGFLSDFTLGRVDLSAHLPVNPSATLNLRAFAGGAVTETTLPPQFQRALGGIGTLPGFGLFHGACGSRDNAVRLASVDTAGTAIYSDERLRPAYGCDRVLLGQLEYRGGFGFGHDDAAADDDEWWRDWKDANLEADWAFFVDVAQGWSFGDLSFANRVDTETMADIGLGLLFDEVGIYAALPITGDDQSLRLVGRLQRRF